MSTISKQNKFSGAANKLPHWERLLDNYIQTNIDHPFEWGAFDCVSFANGAFKVQYGFDCVQANEYSDAKSALKALKKICKTTDLAESVDQFLTRINPNLIRRGDIALVEGNIIDQIDGVGASLGVCIGDNIACVSMSGLVFVSFTQARIAWRV